jgi:hypothetical protein
VVASGHPWPTRHRCIPAQWNRTTDTLIFKSNDQFLIASTVRIQLLDGINRVAKGVAISMGVPEDRLPEVIRSPVETTPPTLNDTAINSLQ